MMIQKGSGRRVSNRKEDRKK